MFYANALETLRLSTPRAATPFEFWLAVSDRAAWTEAPNRRRGGVSGMRRATLDQQVFYIKTQTGHCHRSWRYPFGRPTALREAEALEACHRLGILAPQIVFCETRRQKRRRQTLLVTRSLDGFVDLEAYLLQSASAIDLNSRHSLLDRIAATLARLHGARWQHSSLYAKHIFIAARDLPEGRGKTFDVALIDLEKARRRMSVDAASRHDIRQFQRHCDGFDRRDWQHFLARYRFHLSGD